MLIIVYGDNGFLASRKVKELREHFVSKFDASGMNVAEFDGAKATLGEVMQAVQSPPFLSEKRMVIVRDLLTTASTKADAKPWIEALERIPESTIVLLADSISSKKGVKHALVKEYEGLEGTHVYPFEELLGVELTSWAARHAKEIGLDIDRLRLQKVAGMVGSDLWQLSGELEKLAAYSGGEKVTAAMIELLVRTNVDDQMFALMDAVSAGDARKTLSLLEDERLFGAAEGQLFSMLARQVRLLLGVRDLLDGNPAITKQDVASELGVHPFVAQKTLAQARGFSAAKLEHLHTLLYKLDRLIKRGGVGMDVAVDRVVVGLVT